MLCDITKELDSMEAELCLKELSSLTKIVMRDTRKSSYIVKRSFQSYVMACIKDGKYHFTYHYFAAVLDCMLASKTATGTGLWETFSRDWFTRTVLELSNYYSEKLNIHAEFKCDGDISSKDSSNFDDAVKMALCLGDIQAWLNLETKARTFYLLVLRVLQNTAEYDAYVVDLLSKIISLPNTDLSHKAQREEYFSKRYKERVRLNQWSTVTTEEILESLLKK